MAAPPENVRTGAALLVVAGMFFASVSACIKLASAEVSTEAIVFFRSSLGFLPMIPFLFRAGLRGLRTSCIREHLIRALAGVVAMYCYFYAIGRLPLAEAVVLSYTAPLFIPFVARSWLDEPIAPGAGMAAAIGFAGTLLILKPGTGFLSTAALVGVIGGMLAALAFVGIRRLSETEPTTRTVFYFSTISSTVSAVPLAFTWETPPPSAWGLLVMIGVLAGCGQIALTKAYAYAPAARISPFSYTTVIFATLIGWGLWNEVPDGFSFLGALLVCVAGVLATRRRHEPAPVLESEPPVTGEEPEIGPQPEPAPRGER